MASGVAIEHNGPEFADGITWPSSRAEDRIPDPERLRPCWMVGALKITLVVAGCLSGPITCTIEVVSDHCWLDFGKLRGGEDPKAWIREWQPRSRQGGPPLCRDSADVGSWLKADVQVALVNVRCCGKSGHRLFAFNLIPPSVIPEIRITDKGLVLVPQMELAPLFE
jgi:hypothetical protein